LLLLLLFYYDETFLLTPRQVIPGYADNVTGKHSGTTSPHGANTASLAASAKPRKDRRSDANTATQQQQQQQQQQQPLNQNLKRSHPNVSVLAISPPSATASAIQGNDSNGANESAEVSSFHFHNTTTSNAKTASDLRTSQGNINVPNATNPSINIVKPNGAPPQGKSRLKSPRNNNSNASEKERLSESGIDGGGAESDVSSYSDPEYYDPFGAYPQASSSSQSSLGYDKHFFGDVSQYVQKRHRDRTHVRHTTQYGGHGGASLFEEDAPSVWKSSQYQDQVATVALQDDYRV
jgi:hypothetical protein